VLSFTGISTLQLVSGGSITQGVSNSLTIGAGGAGTLTGSAGSAVSLLGTNNLIGAIGSFSSNGGFALIDAGSIAITGPLADAAPGALVSLASGGAISETVGGSISGGTLTLSGTTITLGQPNTVADLGNVTATTSFTFADSTGLIVIGLIDPPDVSMTIAGPLTINTLILGGAVSLLVGGTISEGPGGGVFATTLSGSATLASFAGLDNTVTMLGSFSTTSGFTLNDGRALTVSGPVTDGASVALTSIGTLTLAGNITAPIVSLTATNSNGTAAARGDIVATAGTIAGSSGITLVAAGLIDMTGGVLNGSSLTGSASLTASATNP
jgi:hypothetical protein